MSDYSRHYQKFHPQTVKHSEFLKKFYDSSVREYLDLSKKADILDIGCGSGLFLNYLRDEGFSNAVGVDIDADLIAVAKQKGLTATATKDTVHWLTRKNRKYDCIICFDVLEHLDKKTHAEMLKAIHNILKDGGLFIGTIPNASSFFASRWLYTDYTHKRSYTEYSIESYLHAAKLTCSVIRPIEFFLPPKRIVELFSINSIHWLFHKIVRTGIRLIALAELGIDGAHIPLSLNLFFVAKKL